MKYVDDTGISYEIDPNLISQRLQEVLTEKNISYNELEKMTGIPKSALQRYAAGTTKKIPTDRIRVIALKLHVNLLYLLGLTDDPNELPVFNVSVNTDKVSIVNNAKSDKIQKLLNYFCQLSDDEMIDLIRYAEFLYERGK